MQSSRFRVERLERRHNRAAFSCGEYSLDAYLRERARQDAERHVTTVYILHDTHEGFIAGYYTLNAGSILLTALPAKLQRGLPRYPQVPVVLRGRLAIDQRYQSQSLGEALLIDALRRAHRVGTEQIAAAAVVVDALHDRARNFYLRYGFDSIPENSLRLYLPMQSIAQLLKDTAIDE